jgi:oxygen-independent coproporphyrinogen-3 oxidase
VRTMVGLPLKHLSMYFLTVHEDTALYFRVLKRQVTLAPDDAVVDLYKWTIQFLAEHGFVQYEVSSFARAQYQSRHNKGYWQRRPYKGFGLGACSFDGQSRFQNEKNLAKYLVAMQTGTDITIFNETLTEYQAHLEKIMLGVRQAVGVERAVLREHVPDSEQQSLDARIAHLAEGGFIVEHDGRLILTAKGLAVEHYVAQQLVHT